MGESKLSTPDQKLEPSYATAKAFTLTSAFWFAVATSLGLIGAGYLIAPDFLANIEYIHFGRVRPMHVNSVLFGFVTPGLLAAAFYYFPKLLRTELFSEKLGVLTAIFWNITVTAGIIGIAFGHTQGREYAELPWAVDIMVVISFALVVFNVLMTIRRRKEPILFVSVWYTTAAVILTSLTYCLGNVIWKPDTGALLGIPDAILLWFYGHNIFGWVGKNFKSLVFIFYFTYRCIIFVFKIIVHPILGNFVYQAIRAIRNWCFRIPFRYLLRMGFRDNA